ncbi:hypothetical protein D9M72_507070 [compost metagenome]
MGLVDGEKRNAGIADEVGETVGDDALGRHIKQIERTVGNLPSHRDRLFARQRRIERCRIDAELLQRLDLIAHQGDQRRNDDAEAGTAECRDLEAERLASTGRKQNDGVTA